MKKIHWSLVAVAILVIACTPAIALANAGVHGDYTMSTDACAGCHRAHTAPSSITWLDSNTPPEEKSALLLTTATDIETFCMVCHDTAGQGADTNVEGGQYNAVLSAYGTDLAPLNGGAFGRPSIDPTTGLPAFVDAWDRPITSKHSAPGGWVVYGAGAWGSTSVVEATGGAGVGGVPMPAPGLSCDTCHDVHGSSNYRILKDYVWGVKVGGYDDASPDAVDPNPTPYVESCEPGYPVGGFRLHTDYEALGYTPNYTTAMYARPPGNDVSKGMVGWCVGCHTVYNSTESTYDAGDWYGNVTRHRHAMNVPMSNFYPVSRSLIVTSNPLPLAHDIGTEAGAISNNKEDWLECLTCHNAHGTAAVMTGYANVLDSTNPEPDSGLGGVPPDTGSGLLKMDNRGVCENCHNK